MRKWLVERFLPMWAKETVLKEKKELMVRCMYQQLRIRELESYIKGMHKALARKPKVEN